MRRQDKLIADIVNASRLIMEFTENLAFAEFEQDVMRQSAVLHQLLIIGEAVKALPTAWRSQHTNIP